jgi:tetratricopeptide (TPR) repeat protein
MMERGNGLIKVSRYFYIMILMSLCYSEGTLFSQNIPEKPLRQTSIEAFNAGNFEKAYQGFTGLLAIYPKDPLYKYYSGVSLVNLNREPEQAITLLKQSLQGTSVARNIPPDALFWLGRAQQMSGKFNEAIFSFETYSQQAGKKASRNSGVPEYIQQCKDSKGELVKSEPVTEIKSKETARALKPQTMTDKSEKNVNQESVTEKQEKEAIPDDYDKILSEAMKYQVKSDSLYKAAESMKKNLDNQNYKDKAELKSSITQTESMAASFQKLADQKYAQAQAAMNARPFAKEDTPVIVTQAKNDTSGTLKQEIVTPVVEKGVDENKDAVLPAHDQVQVNKPVEAPTAQAVKNIKPDDSNVVGQTIKKISETFSVFEVTEKPVYKATDKISINPEIPQGLIYRIQVAVFRNPVSPSYFKGITPVYGFKVAGTDRTNYYAGMFRRLADANKALAIVRRKGFKDAFVISLSGGKAVSAERAAILEKEWGKKPFITEINDNSRAPADTVPPTLSFRVEVMRAMKPPKDDVLAGLNKLAGTKGLDSVTLQDGTIVYLIGKFITFESAVEYADLLARNGYREARVSAWLGIKEIPVETAKQLFERVE